MKDIAPELLEQIEADFDKLFESDSAIRSLREKLKKGVATYEDAQKFAIQVGNLLAKTFDKSLSSEILPDGRFYYNIAERILNTTLKKNHELISDYAASVQNIVNQSIGVGIKAQKAELNQDRIDGIIDIVSGKRVYDDIKYMMKEPIVNYSQAVVDSTLQKNVEFQGKSGLTPKVTRRTTGKACKSCAELAGSYEYPDVPKNVYQRHQNCRCIVEYDPGNGRKQNAHTKQWKTQEEYDRIEARKIAGLIAEDDEIMRNIRKNIIPKQNIERIVDRQQIHRVGTNMYEQRKVNLQNKEQYGPSYLTISDEEILELVEEYSGKGLIKYDRRGQWNQQEIIVTNDKVIGVVFNNKTGENVKTSVFKIHYGKNGIHIVPDYPSKKR